MNIDSNTSFTFSIKGILIVVALIICILMFGMPYYSVWRAGMKGKAELSRANFNRQVKVAEANAAYESAKYYLQRDTIQAYGIARANAIIGNSLKNNEPYLYFKWLQTLEAMKGQGQVIYLPGTFPNLQLPITEAGRFSKEITRDSIAKIEP